jgi:hypothetical protein
MIQLVEVCELSTASKNTKQRFTLREVYINPKHIISLREDANFKQKLNEGQLPEGLNNEQRFTRIAIDKGHTGLEIVVVGDPTVIETKLKGVGRELLLG